MSAATLQPLTDPLPISLATSVPDQMVVATGGEGLGCGGGRPEQRERAEQQRQDWNKGDAEGTPGAGVRPAQGTRSRKPAAGRRSSVLIARM